MNALTVATRGSELAIVQTELVVASLKKIYPDIKIKIKKVTAEGDRDRRTALWQLKTSGFFTSQIEDVLLAGDADFAVHSLKDLPTQLREGLTIAAVCDRQSAADCLITTQTISSIDQLKAKAKMGTSSLRRIVQIRRLRPDLIPISIRGNVTTRIKQLSQGKFDAIILAQAGIERLNLSEKIAFSFDPTQFIPAPAQGVLAVQTRTDDTSTIKIISAINDPKTSIITFAERQILITMNCGCHAPVGAFAEITGNDIEIYAFLSDLEGKNFIKRQIKGPTAQANHLAEKLANELLNSGGKIILQSLEK
jgi:hydroxymethylbilane synthase